MMVKALNNSGRNSMIVGGLSALISFMFIQSIYSTVRFDKVFHNS